MKRGRQEEILKILEESTPQNQEQLLQELRQRGFSATQATISRDIRQLGLVKRPSPQGGFRFIRPEAPPEPPLEAVRRDEAAEQRLERIFRESVLSATAAQNLVVIKTMPGLAPAACSALDGMEIPGMVGTLAGDDTGLLILQTSQRALEFQDEIEELLM